MLLRLLFLPFREARLFTIMDKLRYTSFLGGYPLIFQEAASCYSQMDPGSPAPRGALSGFTAQSDIFSLRLYRRLESPNHGHRSQAAIQQFAVVGPRSFKSWLDLA
jgi:hypothetical protein